MDWVTVGRSLFTVVCFAFFIAVLIMAYSKRSKSRYEEAANLPFLDDDKVEDASQDEAAHGARK
ncbi:CcoQ/FixQ family Cbb3-type cytochrome c oxidase assembly chaperone [Chromobacterium phragmitis]|uniref:Cbb3-type cytochrome c oxidase subunit 3 n=1 Tax=Chromobacterium phragmitis TaxID=2202141 RepID=A0A344ULN1_9NEIS|nr:cbb3-type cytochrome c oxidase subunit 3 [Chromobacterium phragmitis]AXE30801.1 CcoQ/FixQ family Cbb3-type cytochrome c oxidase assembly chaperone [Chromobacterium phragmitis]AXE36179.1 CcoQ/FixQ family Cbb3-type cytochrome c oxidase assembly chaperone [Chromobacterium phragmitis]